MESQAERSLTPGMKYRVSYASGFQITEYVATYRGRAYDMHEFETPAGQRFHLRHGGYIRAATPLL